MRLLAGVAILLALCTAGIAGEPANVWTTGPDATGEHLSGLVYTPELNGMFWFGEHYKVKSSDTLSLTTADLQWHELLPGAGPHPGSVTFVTQFKDGRPGLPSTSWWPNWYGNQMCYLPSVKKILLFAAGSTFLFDPAAKTWEQVKLPLLKSPPDVTLGAMAWDPVHKRAILFGGGYLCAYKTELLSGFKPLQEQPWTPDKWDQRGTWAFDPQAGAWSKLTVGSEPFRARFTAGSDLQNRLIDLIGAVRGIALEYGDMVSGKKPGDLAGDVSAMAAAVEAEIKTLAAGGGCSDAYESAQCREAALTLGKVAVSIKAAAQSLAAGDGWKTLRGLESARWDLFEAVEAVAPAPLPRYYHKLVTDTKNNVLVLFGGFGGNKLLADTWVFDLDKQQWRRSKCADHPPFPLNGVVAMSYDSDRAVTFLLNDSDAWVYDAAADTWKTFKTVLPPPTDPKGKVGFLLGFKSMEYDPVAKRHVLLTTAGAVASASPRRTAKLELDPSVAVKPDKPGGPIWKWLTEDYQKSWAALPADQAAYRQLVEEHKKFLADLKPNVWTPRPVPYETFNRGYGSFCLDWDRGQIDYWGGGHSTTTANNWSQYDLKSDRWMESWPPDHPPWPYGCCSGCDWSPAMNGVHGSKHGYHKYAYCSDIRRVIFEGRIYDPDRMVYDKGVLPPLTMRNGLAVDMSGAPGSLWLQWARRPVRLVRADPKALTATVLENSAMTYGMTDRSKQVYDTTRDRVLYYGVNADGTYTSMHNRLAAFDLKAGKWSLIEPTIVPAATTAPEAGEYGVCYSPKHDILMILPSDRGGQKTWIYDCAKNQIKRLDDVPVIKQTTGIVYDQANDLFISMEMGGYGVGPVCVYYFRYQKE